MIFNALSKTLDQQLVTLNSVLRVPRTFILLKCLLGGDFAVIPDAAARGVL